MIFARNITSSLYADIIVYLDNLIFRNFQDEELPPAVLRAIGWTRTPHDVEHAAVPDLTVHLLLDPREGHLRLESKEGAVPSARFHAAISRIGSPFFEISPNIPTVCAINSYSLSLLWNGVAPGTLVSNFFARAS